MRGPRGGAEIFTRFDEVKLEITVAKNELFKHIGDTRAEFAHTTGIRCATPVPW